jgi:hypothetical protein
MTTEKMRQVFENIMLSEIAYPKGGALYNSIYVTERKYVMLLVAMRWGLGGMGYKTSY